MERTLAEQYNSHLSPGCFLVAVQNRKGIKGLRCFEGTETWKLSQLSFLVSLKRNVAAIGSLRCYILNKSGCNDLQLMPDIMCDYEANSKIANFDLNQHFNEFEPVYNTGKPASLPLAKVIVVKWKGHDSKDVGEEAAFTECVVCLAIKHRVVLISVLKRYVWVVDSGVPLSCKECDGKVIKGPRFLYNQYLRQIPVVKAREYFWKSLKRKRESF